MNTMTIARSIASTLALTSIVACSGGGGSNIPSASTDTVPHSTDARTGNVLLSFRQQLSTETAARKREFLSFGAQSVTITVDAGSPTTLNLANCSSNSTGTQAVCPAVGFTAPTGQHTFGVSVFNQQNGGGTALGTGSIVATVAATGTTPLNLTLNGIPSFVVLRLSDARPTAAASLTLTATAFDAADNGIIGTFASPVAVSVSGNTGTAVSLSKTTLTSTTDSITVTYNGTALTQPVVFTPSTSGTITAIPVSLLSGTSQSELVTVNTANGTPYYGLDVYDASKTGVQSPIYSLSGSSNNTGATGGLAFSPTGDIFYAAGTYGLQEYQNYQNEQNGPFQIVGATNKSTEIATDSTGLVYAVSQGNGYNASAPYDQIQIQVAVYKTPFYNSQYPMETLLIPVQYESYPLNGSDPHNNYVVAIDPTNAVWVPGSDGIDRFSTVNGPTTETKSIAYGTVLKGVTDMAFGPKGELWVCDSTGSQVVKIAAGATTATGAQVITGANVAGCSSIKVDSNDNVYVQLGSGSNIPVNVFAPTASGAATPTRVITLKVTGGTFALYNI